MDSNIILSYGSKTVSTVISNTFIDKFMPDANGGYIKVYVYLLRCHQDPTITVTIASIADALGEEQKYIKMALKYWNDQGVISITKARNGQITNIVVRDLDEIDDMFDSQNDEDDMSDAPIMMSAETSNTKSKAEVKNKKVAQVEEPDIAEDLPVAQIRKTPAKKTSSISRPTYSSSTMAAFKKNYTDFAGLLKYLEASVYLEPLTNAELQLVCYFYDQLEFPADLIEYLYDYCFNTQKKTANSYIEAVAIKWHEEGISNVDMAKAEVNSFSSSAITVKTALGLSDKLKPAETDTILRWSREYEMSDDIIKEACTRAVLQTTKPSLNYVNTIITDWHTNNVKSLDDIKKLDAMHLKARQSDKSSDAAPASRQPKGAYFQYPQRTYSDKELNDIEKRKLRQSKLCT